MEFLSSCDLLENIYLCGINNNPSWKSKKTNDSCDLLKNIYLCGINNNLLARFRFVAAVVICLKISIFVVSTTTCKDTLHILKSL